MQADRLHPDDLAAIVEGVIHGVIRHLASPQNDDELMTPAQAAKRLGVSRATIYDRAHELRAVRIGNGSRPRLRIPASAIEAFLANQGQRPERSTQRLPQRRRRGMERTAAGARLLGVRGNAHPTRARQNVAERT